MNKVATVENPKSSLTNFRVVLSRGEIPLGSMTLVGNVTREQFLSELGDHLQGKPKDWTAQNDKWERDKVFVEILWYPAQPVFFTFRNGGLDLIEFYGPGDGDAVWDYAMEVQKYFRIKNDIITYLGKATRTHEADQQNMETVWDFPKLTLHVSCDTKTGGCGIGLKPKV